MSTTTNPFAALGLPTAPDLDDQTVRAAWRAIAAATHPDRHDGGDPARYTQASAAYAQLRSPVGPQRGLRRPGRRPPRRPRATPVPLRSPSQPTRRSRPARRTYRPLRLLPARIVHGRPLRLLIRAAASAGLSLLVLWLIPGTAAAPADVAGLGLVLRPDRPLGPGPPPRR